MIYRLTGTLGEIFPDSFVLRAQSIEWLIDASQITMSRLPRDGSAFSVFTHLHHREDVMTLFGFYDRKERDLFLSLVSVQGIGPKAALKILSGISPDDFVDAVQREDLARLERVPGLGKKTAQKILLTLYGKLRIDSENGQGRGDVTGSRQVPDSGYPDLEEALVSMGYDRKIVREILSSIVIQTWNELFAGIEARFQRPGVLQYDSLSKIDKDSFETEVLKKCIIAMS